MSMQGDDENSTLKTVLELYVHGPFDEAGQALNTLRDRYLTDLTACAFRWCGGNASDVDDALQDLWVRLIESRHTFDQSRDWSAWARIILRRLIVRTKSRNERFHGFGEPWELVSETLPKKDFPKYWSEFQIDFGSCLERLDGDLAIIIRWRLLDGMTIREIAELRDLDQNEATALERKAKKMLRACLEVKSSNEQALE